jgi:hypothetical protein
MLDKNLGGLKKKSLFERSGDQKNPCRKSKAGCLTCSTITIMTELPSLWKTSTIMFKYVGDNWRENLNKTKQNKTEQNNVLQDATSVII